jgi:uncharacterized protein YegL
MEIGSIKFPPNPFADNAEDRCPVVLVVDVSGSMSGSPITEVNKGLKVFEQEIKSHTLAALRSEIAIVTFGPGVKTLDVGLGNPNPEHADRAFISGMDFQAPRLTTGGSTPMAEGMERALNLIRMRKDLYRTNAINFYRPWIFLISDGAPDPGWENTATITRETEAKKGVIVFAIGVAGADLSMLGKFCSIMPPMMLDGLEFAKLFKWLSDSLVRVSESRPGEDVPLPPLTWSSIETGHD